MSSTPVDVKAAADISLTLSKGAEGSKVAATGEKTEVAVFFVFVFVLIQLRQLK